MKSQLKKSLNLSVTRKEIKKIPTKPFSFFLMSPFTFIINLYQFEWLLTVPFNITLVTLRRNEAFSFLVSQLKEFPSVTLFPTFKASLHLQQLSSLFNLPLNGSFYYLIASHFEPLLNFLGGLLESNLFMIMKVRVFGQAFSFKNFLALLRSSDSLRFRTYFALYSLEKKMILILKQLVNRFIKIVDQCRREIS
jgi:hypothetical protein